MPHQSSSYNALAGREPAFISSDSDFDSGQDALALEAYFQAHPVPEVQVQLQGTVNPGKLQLPPFTALRTPAAGWIAVSERIYRLKSGGTRGPLLAHGRSSEPLTPEAIIGKTIRLSHVSEKDLSAIAVRHQAPE